MTEKKPLQKECKRKKRALMSIIPEMPLTSILSISTICGTQNEQKKGILQLENSNNQPTKKDCSI